MPISEEYAKEVQELINSDTRLLTPIQKQHQYLANWFALKKECPWCHRDISLLEAAPADFRIDGGHHPDNSYTCPHCQGGLSYTVPFFSSTWNWRTDISRYPTKPPTPGK